MRKRTNDDHLCRHIGDPTTREKADTHEITTSTSPSPIANTYRDMHHRQRRVHDAAAAGATGLCARLSTILMGTDRMRLYDHWARAAECRRREARGEPVCVHRGNWPRSSQMVSFVLELCGCCAGNLPPRLHQGLHSSCQLCGETAGLLSHQSTSRMSHHFVTSRTHPLQACQTLECQSGCPGCQSFASTVVGGAESCHLQYLT